MSHSDDATYNGDADPNDPLEGAESHLEGLGDRFMQAMERIQERRLDEAADLLRGILKVEPRLAEPRMELARVLVDTGQLADAEVEAREALRLLKAGGQWVEEIEENVLLSMSKGLLAEILRRTADQDEVVFGDPGRWQALMEEARGLFKEASELDPSNEHADEWAFELGHETPEA